jgi:hypothetical protein
MSFESKVTKLNRLIRIKSYLAYLLLLVLESQLIFYFNVSYQDFDFISNLFW